MRFPWALWRSLAPAVSLADHRLLDEVSDATIIGVALEENRYQNYITPETAHLGKTTTTSGSTLPATVK